LSQISEYFGDVDDFEQRLQKVMGTLADREREEALDRVRQKMKSRLVRIANIENSESLLRNEKESGHFCKLRGHKWSSVECVHNNELFFCENNSSHRRGCSSCKDPKVPISEVSKSQIPEGDSKCRDCGEEFPASELVGIKSANYAPGTLVCRRCNQGIENDDILERSLLGQPVKASAQ
jgi:hypothetical protein